MEEVPSNSAPALGVSFGGSFVNHLADADDLVLFTVNADRLRERLVALSTSLAAAGMCISGAKSVGLTIRKDGKNKHLILWPTACEVNEVRVQSVDVDQQIKYFGLHFTWKGRIQPRSTAKLESMLLNITKDPLKPHQRLDILARFALLELYHELVLVMAHRRALKSIDVMVRARVRAWLRLPKDTMLGFFYAKRASGGLSLLSLSATVPMAQRTRLERFALSSLAPTRMASSAYPVHHLLRQANIPIHVGASVVTSKDDVISAWSADLLKSNDGRGIQNFPKDRASLL
ncbi:hypothetical protein FGIG_00506 [Fasciola gigantica]|uniref:Reverse transcriptase domain-containing protein n=1 Tax=Fasciola gigantica TaxID=46835 RepID=A0A504Z009_FASGI|nr:hypothetical protein FGIG_00506 [Fasciola gigantica]